MLRAAAIAADNGQVPFDIIVLTQEERHLRRKVVTLQHGDEVLVDLPRAFALAHGARLVLDDGRHVEVIAAEEELYEIKAPGAQALIELAWHIGNRHLAAQIEPDRILIARDHVIKDMLSGLGAEVTDVREPFEPVRGAYHRHGPGPDQGHADGHAGAGHAAGHGHPSKHT